MQLNKTFNELFNESPQKAYFSPGRVNLIGEHIDYNGGLVFPCAITIGTYGMISPIKNTIFNVYSINFKELGILNFSLEDLSYNASHNWSNYVKGVLKVLIEKGYNIPFGFNLAIYGNIPNGSGLSSSASLEILICQICNDLYNLNLKPTEMALIGKEVENSYIGVNSGIMDQFAIALGKADSALLLDCNTQTYDYIPLKLTGYNIVIMNTNKRRELADSKYNERRAECDAALSLLQNHFNIKALCELTEEDLPTAKELIVDPLLYKRAHHAITENMRVIKAKDALSQDDLITFGKLLNASHLSLKEDYEVTGKELDLLVSSAINEEGVLGARMTGAGFGGCAISLAPKTTTSTFIKNVGHTYLSEIGYEASFYIASLGDGPSEIPL